MSCVDVQHHADAAFYYLWNSLHFQWRAPLLFFSSRLGTDIGGSYTHTFTLFFFHSYIIFHSYISFLYRQLFHLPTGPSFAHSSSSNSFIRALIFSILFSTIIRNTSLHLPHSSPGLIRMELHEHIRTHISSSICSQFFIHSRITLSFVPRFSILFWLVMTISINSITIIQYV